MGFFDRFRHGWNAFINNRDPTTHYRNIGGGYARRPDRVRLSRGNERSMMTSAFNRIALDVSALEIMHCQMDKDGRYKETIKSSLNRCLTLEANIDQTGSAFIQDAVQSMFDEGTVALIPIDTDDEPTYGKSFDVLSMRTGRIVEWYPEHVRVDAYNERTGKHEEITLHKSSVAIVSNPLSSVVNEPNSTVQRLIRKLNLLDVIDEQSGSGKLDMIIQLPYSLKTDSKRAEADKRRQQLEEQLSGSKYGIGYIDAAERITQLNRPIENNLMKQIEFLTNMAYSQLGITQSIMDGTADEATMLNYYNRTIDPILSAIVDEMKRKFLSQQALDDGQSIEYFRDPFKLVPVGTMAEIADKFTRNEIMTSNEIRQKIGMKPSSDPKADQLVNSNLNHPEENGKTSSEEVKIQNGSEGGDVNG